MLTSSFPQEFPQGPDIAKEGSASVVNADGTTSPDFPANIAAIATHPMAFDQVLVGLDSGDVYRSVAGSQGKSSSSLRHRVLAA